MIFWKQLPAKLFLMNNPVKTKIKTISNNIYLKSIITDTSCLNNFVYFFRANINKETIILS